MTRRLKRYRRDAPAAFRLPVAIRMHIDWVSSYLGANRSETVRLMVRYAWEQREDFLEWVLVNNPNTRPEGLRTPPRRV